MRYSVAILLGGLLLSFTACETKQTAIQKLELAEQYLRERGADASYRAVAYDLFRDVLVESKIENEKVRAHFGVGIIGTLDLVQAVPQLIDSLGGEAEGEGDAEESTLPPADKLSATIRILVDEVISKGIAEHLKVVSAEDDFSFTFENLILPYPGGIDGTLDLSGEWDLTEIRLIYGIMELLSTTVEYVYAYEGIVETILRAALADVTLPPMPETPAEFPAWIVETARAAGLDPLPWLDPAFGVLVEPEAMPVLHARMESATGALVGAMVHLQSETDAQDDDLFTAANFPSKVILMFAPEAKLEAAIVHTAFRPAHIETLLRHIHLSVADPDDIFVAPDFIWDLLVTALGFLEFTGPTDPVSLRIPAVNLSALFTDPLADLKDVNGGLLPHFNSTGDFTVHTEQEPGNNDAHEDIGVDGFLVAATESTRPGAGDNKWNDPLGLRSSTTLPPISHVTPFDTIDAPNGIVDPVYLFFGDATLNGWLYPITDGTDGRFYNADTVEPYTNPDLMRLLSSIMWIVDGL